MLPRSESETLLLLPLLKWPSSRSIGFLLRSVSRSDRRRRRKTPLVETLVGIVTLLLALVARDL